MPTDVVEETREYGGGIEGEKVVVVLENLDGGSHCPNPQGSRSDDRTNIQRGWPQGGNGGGAEGG